MSWFAGIQMRWEGVIGSGGAINLNSLVRIASSVVGMKLDMVRWTPGQVTERRLR